MFHPISSSFQHQKAHGTVETRSSASADTTDELKLDARSKDIGKKGHEQSDANAQILLTALRNLIVPLVQSVVPNASAEFDGRPEEENLLIALQKYVVSIIGGQVQAENQDEKKITRVINLKALNVPKVPEKPNDGVNCSVDMGQGKLVFHDDYSLGNLLENLRTRVFDILPIRLLYFERLNNSDMLQISLLERADVYTHLAKRFTHTYTSTQVDDSTRLNQLVDVMEYAILSHTWLRSSPGELSYDAWNKGAFNLTHPGYEKLVQFGRASLVDHGISFGWMDTVCIDKSSSSELDESIRSMYKWYQYSSVCIIYLSETGTVSQLAKDPWFTRGWTLQELLAPYRIKFYNCTWKQLTVEQNDNVDSGVQEQITIATTITSEELLTNHAKSASISRKMQWAAKRQVTRAEDIAYSLMGLFNISISIAYGEGDRLAFSRLIKEILNTHKHGIFDIFNWGGEYMTEISSLLPSSPQAFLNWDKQLDIPPILMEPLTLTHMGLRIPVLIVPITITVSSVTAKYTSKGDYYSSVSAIHPEGIILPFVQLGHKYDMSCNVLDLEAFAKRIDDRYAFVVLNCTGDEHNIDIPLRCFAILISYSTEDIILAPTAPIYRITSVYPIVFPLRKKFTELKAATDNHSMRRGELEHHGMQFLSMYI